jgi:hypothetical protein
MTSEIRRAWITESEAVSSLAAGLAMSRLCKKGWIDLRQGSPNEVSILHGSVLRRDLTTIELSFCRGGITDFERKKHCYAKAPHNPGQSHLDSD